MNLTADLYVLLPEIILAVGAMALLLMGAISGEKHHVAISVGAIALLVIAGAVLPLFGPHAGLDVLRVVQIAFDAQHPF